jgi:two-component system alkaline phosphatase synthesis response regulator PhoP
MAKQKIMIVDDTEGIRRGLSLLLRAHGFEPISASSGTEALDLLETTLPDLMILDLSMPDTDGLMLMEQIREWPDLNGMPILVYSAVSDDATKQRARRLGAVEFIEKGSTQWEDLAERILWHLAQHAPPAATMQKDVDVAVNEESPRFYAS